MNKNRKRILVHSHTIQSLAASWFVDLILRKCSGQIDCKRETHGDEFASFKFCAHCAAWNTQKFVMWVDWLWCRDVSSQAMLMWIGLTSRLGLVMNLMFTTSLSCGKVWLGDESGVASQDLVLNIAYLMLWVEQIIILSRITSDFS